MQRGRTREVDAERGLAHCRSSRDDDHLARLQAQRRLVDVAESGHHAFGDLAVLLPFDLVEGVGDDGADRRVILTHLAGRHLVDLGLGEVHDVFGLRAFRGVAELRDFGARGDDVAQDGALVHDVGVEGRVRRGRHGGDEAVQVVGAAHLFQIAVFEQLVGDEHGVDRLGRREQVDDRLVHGLVARLVEVGDVEHLRHLADGVLAHQHAAEHGHFRGVVVRRHAVEQRVADDAAGRSGGELASPRRIVAPRIALSHAAPSIVDRYTVFLHARASACFPKAIV